LILFFNKNLKERKVCLKKYFQIEKSAG